MFYLQGETDRGGAEGLVGDQVLLQPDIRHRSDLPPRPRRSHPVLDLPVPRTGRGRQVQTLRLEGDDQR